jgi:hypothetical protein
MTLLLPKKIVLRAILLTLLAAITVVVVLSTRKAHASLTDRSALGSEISTTDESTSAKIFDHYGKLPLSFEPNEGQTNQQVKFLSRGPGYDLFLTATGAVLTLQKPQPVSTDKFKPPASPSDLSSTPARQAAVLRLKMIGTNPQVSIEGQDKLPGKINYLVWRRSKQMAHEYSHISQGALRRDLSESGFGLLRQQNGA